MSWAATEPVLARTRSAGTGSRQCQRRAGRGESPKMCPPSLAATTQRHRIQTIACAPTRRSDRAMIASAPRTWPRVTGSSGWLLAGAELACAYWKGRCGKLACALQAAPGSPATAGSCLSLALGRQGPLSGLGHSFIVAARREPEPAVAPVVSGKRRPAEQDIKGRFGRGSVWMLILIPQGGAVPAAGPPRLHAAAVAG